jgi:hypothetical protein
MPKSLMPILPVLAAALFLAACSTAGGQWGRQAGVPAGPVVENPLLGASPLAHELPRDDRARLFAAMGQALAAENDQPNVAWRGGARGAIEAGPPFLRGVEAIHTPRLTAPVRLDTASRLEPESGTFETTANVNVRLGPATGFERVDTLPAGTVVDAFGRTVDTGEPWLLIGRRDRAFGYMAARFLDARGSDALALAGGVARRPELCRPFRQEIVMPDGRADRWQGVACRTERGWRVMQEFVG